jgi:hypothetical protein
MIQSVLKRSRVRLSRFALTHAEEIDYRVVAATDKSGNDEFAILPATTIPTTALSATHGNVQAKHR